MRSVGSGALRERGELEVPDFDPMDAGVEARILFLFEKPGPMTSKHKTGKRVGSGFISRDNDDPGFKHLSRAGSKVSRNYASTAERKDAQPSAIVRSVLCLSLGLLTMPC